MIPSFIKPYLYSISFEHIRNDLLSKGSGAFAFFTLFTDTTDSQGKKRTMEWAMLHANNNQYLAEKMLKMPDSKNFGFAYVKQDGSIAQFKFNCQGVLAAAGSLDALVEDMKKKGVAVDSNKICDPNWMYKESY